MTLQIHFISHDWARTNVYEFPLNALTSGDLQEFQATSAMGQPIASDKDPLNEGEPFGHIQFLLKGEGNAPINLNLGVIGAK